MNNPPPVIMNGRVLYYAVLGKSIRYSDCKLMFVGPPEKLKELKKVPRVAICADELGKSDHVLLVYCSKEWEAIGSSSHDSVQAAMHRAERMYPGVSALWVEAKVTKQQEREYRKRLHINAFEELLQLLANNAKDL